MEFSIKKVIIRRFCELFFTDVVLSSLLTFANVAELLGTQKHLSLGLIAGVVIFMILNVQMSRHCYFDLRSNRIYYFCNLLSFLLFSLLGFLIHAFCPNWVFTWMFSITKYLKYINSDCSTLFSMVSFYAIGLLCVVSAPIGMGWVFEKIEEDFEE